jgi:hypothetical protein
MTSTVFVDYVTPIKASWLNDVNNFVYTTPIGVGTVTSASVTTANGFSGTVATPTTTPAISLSTSITGVLKGSSGSLVAAINSDLPAMTATVGGAVPTPPNNTTTFLRGDGTFASPGGSMTYPSGTGIAVVTSGTSWGTTLSAPTSTIVGVSDSQALTNKTYNGNTFTAGTGVLTIAAAKTLTANNTLTLAGTDSTTMTFPPASASIGYLNIPQNSQAAGYTLVLGDAGKHIYMSSAGTFTIPANGSVAFPVGTTVTFYNASASSTIPITTDTLVWTPTGGTGTRTIAQYGLATIVKVASTTWVISGTGLT